MENTRRPGDVSRSLTGTAGSAYRCIGGGGTTDTAEKRTDEQQVPAARHRMLGDAANEVNHGLAVARASREIRDLGEEF